MKFDDIKKGKIYVVKEEWREIKNNELHKYAEITNNPQQWPYDWPEFKWLMSGKKDYLPVNCIERKANQKKDEKYLMVLKI